MVSAHERQSLMREYSSEPACVAALVIKSVAGLVIIALVAAIGLNAGVTDDQVREQAQLQTNQPSVDERTQHLYKTRHERVQSFGEAHAASIEESINGSSTAAGR